MDGARITDVALAADATHPRSPSRARWPGLPLAAWAALVAVGWAWGSALNGEGAPILLEAPPLFGHWDLRLGADILVPVAAAVGIALVAPAASRALSWHRLLVAAAIAAFAWAIALAVTDGPGGVKLPLEGPNEYLPAVGAVGSPGELLSTFTERIGDYTTHVRSHPPGMLLALWALAEVGLGGSWPVAALVIGVAASAVPAALLALRAVAGEGAARRAAPYLVVVPAAVWIASTADAFYMGAGAWAVSLAVLAIAGDGRRSDRLAIGGGLLFGACLFLSYGLAPLAAIPLAVAVAARRARPVLLVAAGAAAVVAAFAAAGFWWPDGLLATREHYLASIARTRPYDYFLIANLAAFALAVGPVAAPALARLRDGRVWLLVGGALAGVAVADLSGMSKAEVERIWLPFVPWVLLATAALPGTAGWVRTLLAAQAACAIAIQVGVRTAW